LLTVIELQVFALFPLTAKCAFEKVVFSANFIETLQLNTSNAI